ncbi:MAG: hypothetical protein IT280_11435 [Ignavibacteria bacterium]|nr:hypothetical protein [Ignavibacteria bacterium]
MKNKSIIVIIFTVVFSFILGSCGKDTTKKDEKTDKQTVTDTTKKTTPPADNTELLAKLKKFREDVETKRNENKLTQKVVEFKGDSFRENLKQKWAKMDAYYDGDKLVRIKVYPHTGISERTEEFYLMDGKLVFVFIKDQGLKKEPEDKNTRGKNMYFSDDKIISYEDLSGEKDNVNEDKKVYEAKLPAEAKELMEISKTAK